MHLRAPLTFILAALLAALLVAACGDEELTAESVTEDDVTAALEDFATAAEDGDGEAVCEFLAKDARAEIDKQIENLAGLAELGAAAGEDVPEIETCGDFFEYAFKQEGADLEEFGDFEVTDVKTEEDGDQTYVVATVESEGEEEELPLVVEDGQLRIAEFMG